MPEKRMTRRSFLTLLGVASGAGAVYGAAAALMSKQAPAQRIAEALAQGAKIHPQYPQEYEAGFSIAWRNVPYSRGGWAGYMDETRRDLYPILNRPDGRWLLVGEQLSYLTGWMAGAFESARVTVMAVHERVSTDGEGFRASQAGSAHR
jgi:monoamine oxidase